MNTALPWRTKVRNAAHDNLYCSQNERWGSLHCFQYNAMYQNSWRLWSVRGFSEPTNYILIQKRLNSHLQYLKFECRYENLITAAQTAAGVCRHGLNLLRRHRLSLHPTVSCCTLSVSAIVTYTCDPIKPGERVTIGFTDSWRRKIWTTSSYETLRPFFFFFGCIIRYNENFEICWASFLYIY